MKIYLLTIFLSCPAFALKYGGSIGTNVSGVSGVESIEDNYNGKTGMVIGGRAIMELGAMNLAATLLYDPRKMEHSRNENEVKHTYLSLIPQLQIALTNPGFIFSGGLRFSYALGFSSKNSDDTENSSFSTEYDSKFNTGFVLGFGYQAEILGGLLFQPEISIDIPTDDFYEEGATHYKMHTLRLLFSVLF